MDRSYKSKSFKFLEKKSNRRQLIRFGNKITSKISDIISIEKPDGIKNYEFPHEMMRQYDRELFQ